MSAVPTSPFDVRIRGLLDAGEINAATDATLREFGPELIAWLCSMLPSEADAHDAFGRMSEELWRSLRRFDGRCSVRTWCYMLARHAAIRTRNQPRRQHEQLVSHVPSVAHAVTHVWNTTRANAVRAQDVYAEIRKALDDEDQALLVLRVDRNLSWREIAIVLLGEETDDESLTRKSAALRKQFERVKKQLRELAAERL